MATISTIGRLMGKGPQRTAKMAKFAGKTVGKGASGAFGFAARHPRAVIGTAAIAGIAAADPLKPITEAYQEEVLGDKQAIRKVAGGAFISNVQGAFMTPSQRQTLANLNTYDTITYNGRTVPPGVEGSVVFGLYNRRLSG